MKLKLQVKLKQLAQKDKIRIFNDWTKVINTSIHLCTQRLNYNISNQWYRETRVVITMISNPPLNNSCSIGFSWLMGNTKLSVSTVHLSVSQPT